MNAKDIELLLSGRHAKDLFVPQCKDGPSWGARLSMIDAWAMNRSWSHLTFWGYEIKVSRSDFFGDNKWQHYLPYCNQLFFVCPKGLIKPVEVPDQVGLLYACGSRLQTAKKAAHRDVEIPLEFWCYLLMCRVKIVESTYNKCVAEDVRQEWLRWLEEKEEDRHLGYRVSRSIRDYVDKLKAECARHKAISQKAEDILKTADACGININTWNVAGALSRQAKALKEQFNEDSLLAMRNAHTELGKLLESVK